MTISNTKTTDGVSIFTVEGQLIVANRQELKQAITEALESGHRKLVLDFTPTAYIDSSGLGALVSINKKVREAGGELRLAGLNEDLSSLFELTKLDTLFALYASTSEALAEF